MGNSTFSSMPPKILVLLFLLLFTATPALAEDISIHVLGQGIYTVQFAEKTPTKQYADQDMKEIMDFALISESKVIPKGIGTTFGYHYTMTGLPEGEERTLSFELHHPIMITPQGDISRSTNFEQAVISGGTFHDLFIFEQDWELVDGDFIFKIFDGKKEISSVTFQIY